MRIAVFALLTSLFLVCCTSPKSEEPSKLSYFPESSFAIVRINHVEKLSSELKNNKLLEELRDISPLDAISKSTAFFKYLVLRPSIIMSFSTNEINDIDVTLIASDSISNIRLEEVPNVKVETLNYREFSLKKYTLEENTFYAAIIGKKEVISTSKIVLENLHLVNNSIANNNELQRLLNVSDTTKVLNLWVNSLRTFRYIQKANNKDVTSTVNYISSWVSLDATIANASLQLNGITFLQDTTNYLNLFKKSKPLPNETISFAPSLASHFSSYIFSDFNYFNSERTKLFKEEFKSDSIFSETEELGIATLRNNHVVFIKTLGAEELTDQLNQFRTQTSDFQGSDIWTYNKTRFIEDSFKPLVQSFEANYSCVFKNTFVFTENEETLKKIIIAYKSGDVLNKGNLFESLDDAITTESSLLTLYTKAGLKQVLESEGFTEISNKLKKTKLDNYLFGCQLVLDDNFYHTNLFIKKTNPRKTVSSVIPLFEIQLDSDVQGSPQFVKNHSSKKHEILVQDVHNILYLIATNGKVLWKKQLNGAIQGKITQVDLYKNSKLQFAFTTNNEFLILDRNGKTIKPFSFKFNDGNLTPLAVFDYNNDKNYRFLVAQGKRVFMYNSRGKIVRGFRSNKTEAIITSRPKHFRIGTKDFILLTLANGKLKILNRTGNDRIKLKQQFDFSANELTLYLDKFTFTTTQGILYQIDHKGAIETTDLRLNTDHSFDATDKTLVVLNDNILTIKGKRIILDLGVYTKPKIFFIKNTIYVSVTDIQNQKTYLFNSNAESISNFPIYGSSVIDMVDMDYDGEPELVVNDESDVLIVYRIKK